MSDYIKKMLADVPADMDGESPTPASLHLFTIDPETSTKLLDNQHWNFFTTMLQNYYFCANVHSQIFKLLSYVPV
jgi:hypothetical protein